MATKFDWYQATIPQPASAVGEGILAQLDGCTSARELDRGGNGYRNSVVFLDARGGELGTMMHGGNAHPNIRATSHRAPVAAHLIRRLWPEHRVTRLDVAIDYTGPGVFDHLHRIVQEVAEKNRLKTGLMFQPDLLDRGRTYRIGSPTSPVMVRLYEKGLMESTRGRDEDPDWTRLELQVRPQRAAKSTFANIEPEAAWGAAKWSSQLFQAVVGKAPERIDANPRNETEWERTQAALVHQYTRHAIEGGTRAVQAQERDVTVESSVDAYIEMLRADLLASIRARKAADGA